MRRHWFLVQDLLPGSGDALVDSRAANVTQPEPAELGALLEELDQLLFSPSPAPSPKAGHSAAGHTPLGPAATFSDSFWCLFLAAVVGITIWCAP